MLHKQQLKIAHRFLLRGVSPLIVETGRRFGKTTLVREIAGSLAYPNKATIITFNSIVTKWMRDDVNSWDNIEVLNGFAMEESNQISDIVLYDDMANTHHKHLEWYEEKFRPINPKILHIYTPSKDNHYYKVLKKKLSEKNILRFQTLDNPFASKEYYEKGLDNLDEDDFKRQFLGRE